MAASRNTTIQNRTKLKALSVSNAIPRHHATDSRVVDFLRGLNPAHYRGQEERQALLYSIGMTLLGDRVSEVAEDVLAEYATDLVLLGRVPEDSFDLLGSVYQYLNTKAENLEKGCFYTGPSMADDFVRDLDFRSGQTIVDPACGSGIFLFRSDAPPEQLFGFDSDPLAVMIAKFNYFIKFPDGPVPNLFCVDFFDWYPRNPEAQFDYLIANPPYGANIDLPDGLNTIVRSGESFSYFVEFGMRIVRPDGLARFLVPDALLNVNRHQDIRRFLLDDSNLLRVKRYGQRFSGLMSDVHQLEVKHGKTSSVLMEGRSSSRMSREFIESLKDSIFSFLTSEDIRLIEHARAIAPNSLASCSFGLGVVTGDNRVWLTETQSEGQEAIFSGREVDEYRLRDPRWFISFERDRLQQVAPDEIYRAPVKLVYQTISRTLRVAVDRSRSLTTNSANIIIPDESVMSAEAWAAVLNSSFMSYLYVKMFGDVNKIGKKHLLALPIPALSKEQDDWLAGEVASVTQDRDARHIDDYVCQVVFGLTPDETRYVRHAVLP